MDVHDVPTVFFVEDDVAVRDALMLLATTAGLSAESYEDARSFLAAQESDRRPGCVVADLRMPGMSGLDLLRTLKERQLALPFIMVSGEADVPSVVTAFRLDAIDFLEKPFSGARLVQLIGVSLAQDAEKRAQQRRRQTAAELYRSLTPRERQVFELLVAGLPGKKIAARLGISYRTMEKFQANIRKKMQTDSIAHLTRLAMQLGILTEQRPCRCDDADGISPLLN